MTDSRDMTGFKIKPFARLSGLLLSCSGLFVGCSLHDLDYLSEEQGVDLTGEDTGTDTDTGVEGSGGSGKGDQMGSGGEPADGGDGGEGPAGSGGKETSGGNASGGDSGSDSGGSDSAGGSSSGSGGGSGDPCDLVACSTSHVSSSTCSEGVCQPVCDSGYASCNDSSTNDGCETDVTRPEDCGSCGRECSQSGVSSARCSSGTCNPICFSEYGNCQADDGMGDDDGCETHFNGLKSCGKTCGALAVCGSSQVCNNGTCGQGLGLGVMVIPFSNSGQRQRYAYKFPVISDLSGSTILLRLYSPGVAIQIDVYASDENSNPSVWQSIDLTGKTGWIDLEIDIVPEGNFDISNVKQITWEYLSLSAASYSTTKFSLDRIWSTRLSVDDSFDSDLGGLHTSNYVVVNGSQLYWSNNLP